MNPCCFQARTIGQDAPSLPPTALWNKIRPATGAVDLGRSEKIVQQVLNSQPVQQPRAPLVTSAPPAGSANSVVTIRHAAPTTSQQPPTFSGATQTLLLSNGKTVTLTRPLQQIRPQVSSAAQQQLGAPPPQQLVIVSQSQQQSQQAPIPVIQGGGVGAAGGVVTTSANPSPSPIVLTSPPNQPTVVSGSSTGGGQAVFRLPTSAAAPGTVFVEASGIAPGQPSTSKPVPQAVLVS